MHHTIVWGYWASSALTAPSLVVPATQLQPCQQILILKIIPNIEANKSCSNNYNSNDKTNDHTGHWSIPCKKQLPIKVYLISKIRNFKPEHSTLKPFHIGWIIAEFSKNPKPIFSKTLSRYAGHKVDARMPQFQCHRIIKDLASFKKQCKWLRECFSKSTWNWEPKRTWR